CARGEYSNSIDFW
nr:immunoglobulin heavy chain junction region [Macaca mulatta]MOX59369.1 immunoglobulin heavy chain junction region [Macaca mulatta]MOX59402.1 immunoglobulin heavy chain junction region [Macaca mulatta]MOX59489.1 immunoglobulin heavy chain junction region [Macaca mulatta]MOX59556.1 immunoglobulin heavy chain junction region [Macaca mulatta]